MELNINNDKTETGGSPRSLESDAHFFNPICDGAGHSDSYSSHSFQSTIPDNLTVTETVRPSSCDSGICSDNHSNEDRLSPSCSVPYIDYTIQVNASDNYSDNSSVLYQKTCKHENPPSQFSSDHLSKGSHMRYVPGIKCPERIDIDARKFDERKQHSLESFDTCRDILPQELLHRYGKISSDVSICSSNNNSSFKADTSPDIVPADLKDSNIPYFSEKTSIHCKLSHSTKSYPSCHYHKASHGPIDLYGIQSDSNSDLASAQKVCYYEDNALPSTCTSIEFTDSYSKWRVQQFVDTSTQYLSSSEEEPFENQSDIHKCSPHYAVRSVSGCDQWMSENDPCMCYECLTSSQSNINYGTCTCRAAPCYSPLEIQSPCENTPLEYVRVKESPSISNSNVITISSQNVLTPTPPISQSGEQQWHIPTVIVTDHSSGTTPLKERTDDNDHLHYIRSPSLTSLSAASDESFSSLSDLSDNEAFLPSEEQSSWHKIRKILYWSPFIQQFKRRKYPWIQLAGHQGNFQAGDPGTVLKKCDAREEQCFKKLMSDVLRPYVPEYRGNVEKEDENYIQLQDLLCEFDTPCVMDIKMGIRTYLEEELEKAREKPKLRKDMYQKMIDVDPEAPTAEEHAQKGVIKARYMQWRDTLSSSTCLGFRIEGIKRGDGGSSKDFKKTRSEDQVLEILRGYIDNSKELAQIYLRRLKAIRATQESSEFFAAHEIVGSSLLFVHDKNDKADIWMIDFGKTSQLPDGMTINHRSEWKEGNHEDGYLFGLDNIISILNRLL